MTDNMKIIINSFEKAWNGKITDEEYLKIVAEIGQRMTAEELKELYHKIANRVDKEFEYKNEFLYERFESGSNDEEE